MFPFRRPNLRETILLKVRMLVLRLIVGMKAYIPRINVGKSMDIPLRITLFFHNLTPMQAMFIAICLLLIGIAWLKSLIGFFRIPSSKVPADSAISSKRSDLPVDVYLFPALKSSLSGSPFSAKIMAFLRLTGIPHHIHTGSMNATPKGKIPYIIHDGNKIGDSELIIRYLENTFDIPLLSAKAVKKLSLMNVSSPNGATKPKALPIFTPYKKLDDEYSALTDLARICCDEFLYWGLVSHRWLGSQGICMNESSWNATKMGYFYKIPFFMRDLVCGMIRRCVWKDCFSQGLSRHSPADQSYLSLRALKSLSKLLGNSKYLLGDDIITEADCSLFGIMQSFCEDSEWSSSFTIAMHKECPNLVRYNQRMRQAIFPDKMVGEPGFPKDLN